MDFDKATVEKVLAFLETLQESEDAEEAEDGTESEDAESEVTPSFMVHYSVGYESWCRYFEDEEEALEAYNKAKGDTYYDSVTMARVIKMSNRG